jgi:hypothetical protein
MKLFLKSKIINIIGKFKYKQILQCFVKYGRKKHHICGKSFCRHDLQKVFPQNKELEMYNSIL